MTSFTSSSEQISSSKLVEIKDNLLVLNKIDIGKYTNELPITVFSIIGTARTGKSTLLNCISSYLLKKNIKIFNTDDTDEHCTIGIDMYYFEKERIVLLDCQGLKLDDSSNDTKLLLIIYLISDCIIYKYNK
jgi:ABC-type phosphonate transport system ATPase subunit